MVEVESSFSLDGEVQVDQMIAARSKADEASNEKSVALYELPAGVAVDYDASEYQDWNVQNYFQHLQLRKQLFKLQAFLVKHEKLWKKQY